MKFTTFALCGCMLAASGFADPEKLTLDRALELARTYSPELKAARLQTVASEQAVNAAGRWKNPTVGLEAEKIGGDFDGTESAEYSVVLKQTFERGGKRKLERAVAEQSIGIVAQSEAEKELALLAEVRLAFIDVFAQQEIGKVRAEQDQLGRAFVEVARRRLQAGGGSELALAEAELAQEEIKLAQTCCFGDLKAARIRLASMIGIPEAKMSELAGGFYSLPEVAAAAVVGSHPALQRLNARIEVKRAQAALAASRDAADITLGAGYKYDSGDEMSSFNVGFSMPLNFVRSGQAAQAAALAEVDARSVQGEELRRALQQELSALTAVYSGAKLEAEMTRDRLMPKAEKAYALSKAGYEAGRYSWLELISTQQHLAEIRVRYIETLKDAHSVRAEISRFLQEGI